MLKRKITKVLEEWKKEDSEKSYDEEEKWPIYKEDDEDYDNIVTKSFDLSTPPCVM